MSARSAKSVVDLDVNQGGGEIEFWAKRKVLSYKGEKFVSNEYLYFIYVKI